MTEKVITNKTNKQRLVKFKDGSSVAMKKGQSFTTDRDIKIKEEGVVVMKNDTKASTKSTTSTKTSEQSSTKPSTKSAATNETSKDSE